MNWIFILALIPTLRHRRDKPQLSSSLITAAALLVISYTYSTLPLAGAAISTGLLGFEWLILAWQKWRLDSQKPPP